MYFFNTVFFFRSLSFIFYLFIEVVAVGLDFFMIFSESDLNLDHLIKVGTPNILTVVLLKYMVLFLLYVTMYF